MVNLPSKSSKRFHDFNQVTKRIPSLETAPSIKTFVKFYYENVSDIDCIYSLDISLMRSLNETIDCLSLIVETANVSSLIANQ